jgi:uncharacterized repeat protein (TIGR03803 family)
MAFFNVWIWPFSIFAQPNVTFTTLVTFNGTNGEFPAASLLQGSDGNFYGTTCGDGQYPGTVFRMTPSGTLTNLVNFAITNGSSPEAPLIQGTDGNLYGTTQDGGTNGDGTVFSITTNGTFNSLASFAFTNGYNVIAGLVQGTDGNFYGTTLGGGYPRYSGEGTVFKMAPDGTLTSLYTFTNAFDKNNGDYPDGGLVEGNDGNFYGTTSMGGTNGNGTIFKIDTNGVLDALFNFNGNDGSDPTGPLVSGPDGKFYGMTPEGGTNSLGTVFQFATNGTLTSLVSFNGTNGAENQVQDFVEVGGLIQGSDGNFYGETPVGGIGFVSGAYSSGDGTLFQITTHGVLTTLYLLGSNASDGNCPDGGLIQGTDGNFYGVTFFGGTYNMGTIFRLTVPLQPVFQSVAQMNGTLTLVWNSVATESYQLQYTTNLTCTNWTDLGGICTATNGIMSATDVIGSDPQRFYRVVLVQSP